MDYVKCEHCGQDAEVVACTPIGVRQPAVDQAMEPGISEESCVINCPNCGIRTQIIRV